MGLGPTLLLGLVAGGTIFLGLQPGDPPGGGQVRGVERHRACAGKRDGQGCVWHVRPHARTRVGRPRCIVTAR